MQTGAQEEVIWLRVSRDRTRRCPFPFGPPQAAGRMEKDRRSRGDSKPRAAARRLAFALGYYRTVPNGTSVCAAREY